MRISFAIQKDNTLSWINKRQENVSRLSNAITSGTRLSSPADDPTSWARAFNVKQTLREYDSILGNLDFATGWNEATDSALNDISDLISQARQVGISASGPSGLDQSEALASQLDVIITQVVEALNSQYGDQYVFAGTATSSAPFSFDDSTGTLTYSGDSGQVKVRTDRGSNGVSTVNLTGTDVTSFTSGGDALNIVQEVWELKQAVSTEDTNAITEKLNTLEDAFNSIASKTTTTGQRLSALETKQSAITSLQTVMKSRLSDLQDTDLADAITSLTQEQTAYQAALKVFSMTDSLNLASLLG